ncbi:NCS1 family nucleobase:cation symporter-1 [Mycolicibacterium sp. BK556]|uniref:purine-cytosine permease family protein n=1 Tax=unclassified Mycolicibacterium TaxID=2636767 RepID=UPI001613B823|nr:MULTISPECIES: cytosine permease [unclassified Mycolicibacterium]MBB3604662.1 NCS1 family nucleobase:cation symporter-1 [Mycolicibacterium sp. BK556]MBB3634625.1 NCS1 family nucleobase:cation symporter-1 [Mycolicibacterium sp. BK607]MBB3752201.1 NCS1 family nucleobase:cation symporter-1 [Mycolicibacterium sp. BK634]
MPSHVGDMAVETHGIAPIPPANRYGTARRLFTVWFAPQVNMTVVFTGTLAVVLGLGFWLGLLAMVIGTVVGSLAVGYLSTWGPRTGTAQLPNARMAFGGTVGVVAVIQWLSSIAWDGLVGLFGGEALAELVGMPFWLAVVIVLAAQGAIGVFGYEVIHRVQAVMTVVLIATFAVFAWKLVSGHQVISLPTLTGADLAGAFVLEVTIALSLAISWASYASDYSRYLPVNTSRKAVFGYTFGGLAVAYIAVQAIGVAAAGTLTDQTAQGVRQIMGGGVLGAIALLVIALGSVASNAMNDYSGSLALQTVGVRVRRPVSAVVVVVIAFALIMWLHSGDMAARFQGVLLFVSYWIPAFVAIVAIDWRYRSAGRDTVNPAAEVTARTDGLVALGAFFVAFAAAVPFMHTNLIVGPVATALHGADLAYFVNFLVAAAVYGGYRLLRARR